MALFKNVNGVNVELTLEEEAATRADWEAADVAEAARAAEENAKQGRKAAFTARPDTTPVTVGDLKELGLV